MSSHDGCSNMDENVQAQNKELRRLYRDLKLTGNIALLEQPEKQRAFMRKLDQCANGYLNLEARLSEAMLQAKSQEMTANLASQLAGNLTLENTALLCCEWYRDTQLTPSAIGTCQMCAEDAETIAATKSLGRMDASFGAHLSTVLNLARQAAAEGGVPDITKQPLTDLLNSFITQHFPLFRELVQQAQSSNFEQLGTATAYALVFAEWATSCSGLIGLGGSVLDSLVQVMIQTAGYPAEEVACLAVPFWQAYSASVSQNQGYTNVDAQKIRVHFAQLVLSICSGLHFSYRPDAFGDQQLESLTLRRVAMTQTLLQAFGVLGPDTSLGLLQTSVLAYLTSIFPSGMLDAAWEAKEWRPAEVALWAMNLMSNLAGGIDVGCAALTGIFAAVAALPNHSCPYLQISGFNSVARWANWLARHWHATGCAACHLVDNLFSVLQNVPETSGAYQTALGAWQAMQGACRLALIAQQCMPAQTAQAPLGSSIAQPQKGSCPDGESVLESFSSLGTEDFNTDSSLAEAQSEGAYPDDKASAESWSSSASEQACDDSLDLEASDHLGERDNLPEQEMDTCLPDTAAADVKASQAQSYHLTATCSGAAACGLFGSEQEADRQAAPGCEDSLAAAEEVTPETLEAAIQCPSAPAAADIVDHDGIAASETAPTTETTDRPQRPGRWASKALKGVRMGLWCCVMACSRLEGHTTAEAAVGQWEPLPDRLKIEMAL